jgi:hypothetical protein
MKIIDIFELPVMAASWLTENLFLSLPPDTNP